MKNFLGRRILISLVLISCQLTWTSCSQRPQNLGGFPQTEDSGINVGPDVLDNVFGKGNKLPTSSDQSAINGARTPQQMLPRQPSLLPESILSVLDGVDRNDPQAMRTAMAQLAGKILSACAHDVGRLVPQPGETLAGKYAGPCTDTGEMNYGTATLQYPSTSADFGVGNLKLYTFWLDQYGQHWTKALWTPDSSGGATGTGYGNYGTYSGSVTDQPEAATGEGHLISGGSNGVCSTVTVEMTSSDNPIPAKYTEAMERINQCAKQSLGLLSRIVSTWLADLTSSSAQSILKTLGMY